MDENQANIQALTEQRNNIMDAAAYWRAQFLLKEQEVLALEAEKSKLEQQVNKDKGEHHEEV